MTSADEDGKATLGDDDGICCYQRRHPPWDQESIAGDDDIVRHLAVMLRGEEFRLWSVLGEEHQSSVDDS